MQAATAFCQPMSMDGSTSTTMLDMPAIITAVATGSAMTAPSLTKLNGVQWIILV